MNVTATPNILPDMDHVNRANDGWLRLVKNTKEYIDSDPMGSFPKWGNDRLTLGGIDQLHSTVPLTLQNTNELMGEGVERSKTIDLYA